MAEKFMLAFFGPVILATVTLYQNFSEGPTYSFGVHRQGKHLNCEISFQSLMRSPAEDKDPVELPLFDFNSILIATNNFDIENKLGQGGYGPVYKGKLQDGKDVVIKRLSSSCGQGIEEFREHECSKAHKI
ncbi:conserved hypothetical protein [Ricinus communis]|uniref:Protein kinase domain-containing protein n=1 Tax=Ricinus communis TaxID=3988 RepID=B9RXY4_RICCO|nr:conserved hypothetical protein [Ricinus communis]